MQRKTLPKRKKATKIKGEKKKAVYVTILSTKGFIYTAINHKPYPKE